MIRSVFMQNLTKKKKILLCSLAVIYTLALVVGACLIKLYTNWFSDKMLTTLITIAFVLLFLPLLVFISKISMKKMLINDMVFLALMVAVHVIFSRILSIQTPITKISLAFLPMTLCAIKLGAGYTMLMGGLSDIVGAIVFPVGAYFPGFTVTEIVRGFIFGFILHKKTTVPRATATVVSSQIICSFLLNSFWLTFTGQEFIPTLIGRVPQTLIMIPVQIIGIMIFSKYLERVSLNNI